MSRHSVCRSLPDVRTNADIANDTRRHVTVKEDEHVVLKRAIASDGTITVKESELMQLRFRTYDFYAHTGF